MYCFFKFYYFNVTSHFLDILFAHFNAQNSAATYLSIYPLLLTKVKYVRLHIMCNSWPCGFVLHI